MLVYGSQFVDRERIQFRLSNGITWAQFETVVNILFLLAEVPDAALARTQQRLYFIKINIINEMLRYV